MIHNQIMDICTCMYVYIYMYTHILYVGHVAQIIYKDVFVIKIQFSI